MPNVAESFLRGHAHGQAELQSEREQVEREIRQGVLKQNLAREKLHDLIAEYQLKFQAAKTRADVTSGQPMASYGAADIQGGTLPSQGLGLAASPSVQAPTALNPVMAPGLPELGIDPIPLPRQTLDQMVATQHRTAIDKLMYEGQKVGPGETFGSAATGPILSGGPSKRAFQSQQRLYKGNETTLNFEPATGKYFLDSAGTQEADPKDIARIPPQGLFNTPEAKADILDNAQQLVDGNMLPSTLSKRGPYNQILAEANRIAREQTGKAYNPIRAQLEYEAAKRFVGSMNNSQMVRFKGLAGSVVNTIDEVRRLGDTLKQSDIQLWNRVKRSSIQQVYGNTPQSELAAQYVGAINTLKEEFANLANGGYAPTEAAWKLANQQINQDFGFKDLNASLTEVQRLINYRVQAFNELTPSMQGTQLPLQPGPPATAMPSGGLPGGVSVTRRP